MLKSIQFRFRQQDYLLIHRKGFLILCSLLLILFCLLGSWQLDRYHDKKALLTTYQQRSTSEPVPFLKAMLSPSSDLQFQHVSVVGQYVNDAMILVQNRMYQNQLGYEVITPLRVLGQDQLLLIDRGWVARPSDGSLPSVDGVVREQHITGYLKSLNEYQFTLGKNILDTHSLPIVLQKIDTKELTRLTHLTFYPYLFRLDATATDGFVRDWTIVVGPPERHLIYAIQWFLFALVLLSAYVCFCCERVQYPENVNSYAE